MNKMIRHLALVSSVVALFTFNNIAANARAGKSSATISSTQDGAWGSYVTLDGNSGSSIGETNVTNQSNSTNTLWAAGNSKSGSEFCKASAAAGKSGYASVRDVKGGDYRVVLDPSGPLAKGCNGSGSFYVSE